MGRSNPFRFTRTTHPATDLVSLPEAKAICEYQETDRDDLFNDLKDAAVEACEDFSGRQYITATYTGYADCFPGIDGVIDLLAPPFQSVTSINYFDTDGTEQLLADTKYALDVVADAGRVIVKTWDGETWPVTQQRSNAVKIIYKNGYGDAVAAVPVMFKIAVMLTVLDWFNRDAIGELPEKVKAILMLKRVA